MRIGPSSIDILSVLPSRSVRILRWEKPSSASLHPVIFGVSLFKPDSCMNVIRLRASSIKAAHTMWTTDSILELEKRNKIRLYDGPLIALVGSEPPPLEPDEYSLVDASEITCPDDTYGTSEVALRARISLLVSPNLVDDMYVNALPSFGIILTHLELQQERACDPREVRFADPARRNHGASSYVDDASGGAPGEGEAGRDRKGTMHPGPSCLVMSVEEGTPLGKACSGPRT